MGGLLIIIAWTSIARFTTVGRPVHASNKQMMNALLLITVTLTFIPLLTWSLCYVGDWHTRLGHCKGMFWCFEASLFLFCCYHVMHCGSYVWLYALFSLPQVSFQLVSMVRNHPSCLCKNFSKQMMNFKFTVWDICVQTDYEKKNQL